MRSLCCFRLPARFARSVASLVLLILGGAMSAHAAPGDVVLQSPDGRVTVVVQTGAALSYRVNLDGQPVLADSALGLRFRDGTELGRATQLVRTDETRSDATWENPFGKRRTVRDHHHEARLVLREAPAPGGTAAPREFAVVFRVYDDGVAFRYDLPAASGLGTFVLEEERTTFVFPGTPLAYAGRHENGGYTGSQEWEFLPQSLGALDPDAVYGLPLLVQTPAAWVALTESDLLDWAGLWLARDATTAAPATGVTLRARLAPRPDGAGLVQSSAPRVTPWRTLLLAREPGQLIESDLVLNLATPNQLGDTSWIKPGLMAWDHWWSGDVKMDTATVKAYIQLAADMGWPYQLIDWQWYGPYNQPDADLTRVNPALDLPEIRRFAAERGVRLWLWLYWTDADRGDAYERAFALYEQWGIAGVKIDFMDRDDQLMTQWYEKLTRAAARHRLMINFHGAAKPTGLIRTLPNQLTREGILGNEYNRWSKRVTPTHRLTLPFTRFLAGPGDYTPGGFLNRTPGGFAVNGAKAEVQSTRAGELALFVAYESPITCVCDHPDHYRDQPGADFLRLVPAVWDDTRVLRGRVGEELVLARRAGATWFLGALTDHTAREVTVPLAFLGSGSWKLQLWRDGPDTAVQPETLHFEERRVTATDVLTLPLAGAGGAVARFVRE